MENNKHGFIFVTEESKFGSVWNTLFHDLEEVENVEHIIEPIDKSPLSILLKKNKIQNLTNGTLNFYLKKRYALYEVLERVTKKYEKVTVLFLNASLIHSRFPARLLLDYKKKWPNLRYALFYVDVIGRAVCYDADCLRKRGEIFDWIYTFDALDAKKYGIRFWHTIYSKLDQEASPVRDLYYCGQVVSRKQTILDLLEAHKGHDIDLKMNLLCNREQEKEFFEYASVVELGRRGIDIWPYPTVLRESQKAHCILDITQKGQTGLTLRPYEAVVYNRKLLTNNKSILTFPFYDSRYMQYFESVDDIDWDWVKEDIEVDYHYQGEFSPVHLLEDIIASCEDEQNL